MAVDTDSVSGPMLRNVDPRRFRDIMGSFATGVAVVTTVKDRTPEGMTVNSVTAVSLDPILVLVCLTRDSRTAEAVQHSGRFVLNILRHDQHDISNQFARRAADHFTGIQVQHTSDGLPLIDGAIGHLVCDVARYLDGGDHVIVLGSVESGDNFPGDPLVFYRGRYGSYTPGRRIPRDIAIDWFG